MHKALLSESAYANSTPLPSPPHCIAGSVSQIRCQQCKCRKVDMLWFTLLGSLNMHIGLDGHRKYSWPFLLNTHTHTKRTHKKTKCVMLCFTFLTDADWWCAHFLFPFFFIKLFTCAFFILPPKRCDLGLGATQTGGKYKAVKKNFVFHLCATAVH